MAGRTLVRRGVSTTVSNSSTVPRPHFVERSQLERPQRERAQREHSRVEARSVDLSPPVKLHTDDWMHVELPRGDYLMAGLVAVSIAVTVGSVTLLPAMVFFNLSNLVAAALWPKLMLALPLLAGCLGAWSCLRRAKSDRLRQRLFEELRD